MIGLEGAEIVRVSGRAEKDPLTSRLGLELSIDGEIDVSAAGANGESERLLRNAVAMGNASIATSEVSAMV